MTTNQTVPGSIVVGLDASAASHQALVWAARQAHLEGRPLTLVHAIGREVAAWIDAEPLDVRDVLDAGVIACERLFAETRAEIARLAPDVEVNVITRMGGIHETLLAMAADAAMVVMGAHSVAAHPTPALDSVQFLVDAGLPCPVVVPSRDLGVVGRGVMVAADGTPASAPSVEYAFRQAYLHDLPLSVVHCLSDLPATGPTTDLALMDELARMETDLGPSMLGFQRTLLHEMASGIGRRFPTVKVDVVVDEASCDDLLGRACEMDVLVLDRRYTRRAAEQVLASVTSGELHGVVTLLPVAETAAPDEDWQDLLLAEISALDERFGTTAPSYAEPDEAAPEIHPAPELIPVRVRRIPTEQRGPWRYLRRFIDDPDIS